MVGEILVLQMCEHNDYVSVFVYLPIQYTVSDINSIRLPKRFKHVGCFFTRRLGIKSWILVIGLVQFHFELFNLNTLKF